MKTSEPKLKRRFFDGKVFEVAKNRAIAGEIASARAQKDQRYRYDRPSEARICAACAICGRFFWYYRSPRGPINTCSYACASTFKRTSTLIANARRMGEKRRFPQTYKIWNQMGTAPPRIALKRFDRALARARSRRKRRKRQELLDLLKTRTISARELAYIREENFDILLSAVKVMAGVFDAKQLDKVRSRLANMVVNNLDRANAFLSGTNDPATQKPVNWGPTHVALFGRMLNKVVPDLSQSHVHTTTETISADSLTLDQLAAIAAGHETTINITPSKVLTHDPQQASQPDPLDSVSPGPRSSDLGPEPRLDPP